MLCSDTVPQRLRGFTFVLSTASSISLLMRARKAVPRVEFGHAVRYRHISTRLSWVRRSWGRRVDYLITWGFLQARKVELFNSHILCDIPPKSERETATKTLNYSSSISDQHDQPTRWREPPPSGSFPPRPRFEERGMGPRCVQDPDRSSSCPLRTCVVPGITPRNDFLIRPLDIVLPHWEFDIRYIPQHDRLPDRVSPPEPVSWSLPGAFLEFLHHWSGVQKTPGISRAREAP